jgi:hypothetical protein
MSEVKREGVMTLAPVVWCPPGWAGVKEKLS